MYAIASILDPLSSLKIQELWKYLESDCGLIGIKKTPLPHFSWQGANDYQFPQVTEALRKLAGEITPFVVKSAGIGIFTSGAPILYLSLVKTNQMMRAHKKIWDLTESMGDQLSEFYAPDSWMPHITLAYHDITRQNLPCAFSILAFRPFNFDIKVNNIALIYQIDQQVGLREQFLFEKITK